jgi:hypothetical protein
MSTKAQRDGFEADEPFPSGLPGEAQTHLEEIPPAYARAFSVAAFAMNRFFVDHSIRATRLFDNDFEAMFLYGLLAHLNVAHIMPPGSRPSDLLNAEGRVPDAQAQMRPVRLRDLCQVAGRPRETIRRKLERLEARGRVLRVGEGYVIDVAGVEAEMQSLTVDGLRRFMVAAEQVGAALRDADAALKLERRGPAP